MKRLYALFSAALLAASSAAAQNAAPVPQNDALNAALWFSASVEAKASVLTMFRLAAQRLDEALAAKSRSAALEQNYDASALPPAIIVDLDETILDNSAYQSWLIKSGVDYSDKSFDAWVQSAAAPALPGAVAFLRYAQHLGATVFYVSNRLASQEAASRKNLDALGCPMGGNVDTFLFVREAGHPDWGSSKGTRRAFVAKNYRILLLVGDNYGDFCDDAKGDLAARQASFEANDFHVGLDWIFIPNPQYGSFETAPFKGDYRLSPDQRRALKIQALPDWKDAPAR